MNSCDDPIAEPPAPAAAQSTPHVAGEPTGGAAEVSDASGPAAVFSHVHVEGTAQGNPTLVGHATNAGEARSPPTLVRGWAERHYTTLRNMSATDDGDYEAQLSRVERAGSALMVDIATEVSRVLATFQQGKGDGPAVGATTKSGSSTTWKAPEEGVLGIDLSAAIAQLLQEKEQQFRLMADEVEAAKKRLSEVGLLLLDPAEEGSLRQSRNAVEAQKNSSHNQPFANYLHSTAGASIRRPQQSEGGSLLASINALVDEVIASRKTSREFSIVVSNVVGGGAHSSPLGSPKGSSSLAASVAAAPTAPRLRASPLHEDYQRPLVSGRDQLSHILKRFEELPEKADATVVPRHNARPHDEDMYVVGAERSVPRQCYVALSNSKVRQQALHGPTIVDDGAYHQRTSDGRVEVFSREPGSVTWAGAANAYKYGPRQLLPSLNTAAATSSERNQVSENSPLLSVGASTHKSMTATKRSQTSGSQHLQHSKHAATILARRNVFFRHNNNNNSKTEKEVPNQVSLASALQVDGGSTVASTKRRGILASIEDGLAEGYKDHRFVSVDVAAEEEGLEYIDEDSGLPPTASKSGGTVVSNQGREVDEDASDDDDDVAAIKSELELEERRIQAVQGKKRRKPAGGSVSNSAVVLAEPEAKRRLIEARRAKELEQERAQAGIHQKRSQVRMMVSNDFAKMASRAAKKDGAKKSVVDPFAMVRYGDIETLQGRRRASTKFLQGILQTVAQEVQEFKTKQTGGIVRGTVDTTKLPSLQASGANCVESLYSQGGHNSLPSSTEEVGAPKQEKRLAKGGTAAGGRGINSVVEATLRKLAGKSKVQHQLPAHHDDDD